MTRKEIIQRLKEYIGRPLPEPEKTIFIPEEWMKDVEENLKHIRNGMSQGNLRLPLGPGMFCYEENNLRDQIIELRERIARIMEYMKVEEKTQPHRVYLQRRKK